MLKQHPSKGIFSRKPSCLSAYTGTSLEDCITIDFFARYYVNTNLTEEKYHQYRIEKYPEYKATMKYAWDARFDFIEKEINNSEIFVKDGKNFVYAWDNIDFYNFGLTYFLKKEDVLPYHKISFEGTEYYAVNNFDTYLTKMYNKDYMHVPINMEVAKYIESYATWLRKRGRDYYIKIEDVLGVDDNKSD